MPSLSSKFIWNFMVHQLKRKNSCQFSKLAWVSDVLLHSFDKTLIQKEPNYVFRPSSEQSTTTWDLQVHRQVLALTDNSVDNRFTQLCGLQQMFKYPQHSVINDIQIGIISSLPEPAVSCSSSLSSYFSSSLPIHTEFVVKSY